jgi:hypothetical protein
MLNAVPTLHDSVYAQEEKDQKHHTKDEKSPDPPTFRALAFPALLIQPKLKETFTTGECASAP